MKSPRSLTDVSLNTAIRLTPFNADWSKNLSRLLNEKKRRKASSPSPQ